MLAHMGAIALAPSPPCEPVHMRCALMRRTRAPCAANPIARAAARTQRRIAILPIWKEGAATQRFRRGSGPPEKVFNELWKPSRGRLGARRDCKVLDDHKAVDLSLQVGV